MSDFNLVVKVLDYWVEDEKVFIMMQIADKLYINSWYLDETKSG